ncbi:MAG: lipopolysaccharide biosynthesis protein [Fervidobacterium sp.]
MSVKSYIKGFLSFSFGTWFKAFISVFTTPIISYIINPEEFGRASMYTMMLNIGILISTLGTDQAFVRFFYEYSEGERKSLLWNCLLPSLTLAGIISFFFIQFDRELSKILYGNYYPNIGFLFSVSLIVSILQRFNQLTVRMKKRGVLYSLIDIVGVLSNTGATIIYALLIHRDFYALVFGSLMGVVVSLAIGIASEKDYWSIKSISIGEIKKAVNYGIFFVPTFLITWLFQSIDRISIRQYSTFEEIGLYSAASKIASVMLLIQAGFTQFWIPIAYERYEKDGTRGDFFKKANITATFLMFSFGFAVLGFKDILFMLFSQTYREAAFIMPFLIFSPIMTTISETTVIGINFSKKTYWHIVVATLSALVNFIGNTILVPMYGAKGAAISTGLSYIVFFAMRTFISEKHMKFNFEMRRFVVETVIMIFVALFETINRVVILNIFVGLVGMVFTLLLYKNEILQIKRELFEAK